MPRVTKCDDYWTFMCPGCKSLHMFDSRWTFNGDVERPTFQPSLMTLGPPRCHSFVTDGKIQFLADCDHELAGTTVDLEEVEES